MIPDGLLSRLLSLAKDPDHHLGPHQNQGLYPSPARSQCDRKVQHATCWPASAMRGTRAGAPPSPWQPSPDAQHTVRCKIRTEHSSTASLLVCWLLSEPRANRATHCHIARAQMTLQDSNALSAVKCSAAPAANHELPAAQPCAALQENDIKTQCLPHLSPRSACHP